MAGLSSNVMNMKFMQKAQERDQKRAQEVEIKKVKDSSEWVLPNRAAVQRNVKSAIKVQSVGYGSIASMTAPQDDSETEKEELPKPEVSKVCISSFLLTHFTTNH
ncbi:CIC11C00000001327 [Sungouiella intermedia]|uniref:CIC11C00000001327 n=1 Tax=Sungouiella intermedia TaxID=45354 RepID=A0A1L0FR32_9ASCO|nr:CIC11C00000001327 [[Candida] intermedia]